jgi:hypothetical protein
MIKIWKEMPQNILHFKGAITDHEIIHIMCDATQTERQNVDMMEKLAERTGKMSDILMYVSELIHVSENIAERKSN